MTNFKFGTESIRKATASKINLVEIGIVTRVCEISKS